MPTTKRKRLGQKKKTTATKKILPKETIPSIKEKEAANENSTWQKKRSRQINHMKFPQELSSQIIQKIMRSNPLCRRATRITDIKTKNKQKLIKKQLRQKIRIKFQNIFA